MKSNRTHQDDRRNRWFADPGLQCGLLARTILYWLYSICVITAIALVWIVFVRRPETPAEWIEQLWLNCGPLALGSLLILPLVLLDCVRFSRRFAGPMVRFRRALSELANGDPTEPIELRETDFWCDFCRDLNRVSQRLQVLESHAASTPGAVDGTTVDADASTNALEASTEFKPLNTVNADASGTTPATSQVATSQVATSQVATSPAITDPDQATSGLVPTAGNIYA